LLPSIGILLFFAAKEKSIVKMLITATLFAVTIITILLSGERTAFSSTIIAITATTSLFVLLESSLRKLILKCSVVVVLLIGIVFATQDWVQKRTIEFYGIVSNFSETDYWQLAKTGFLIGKEHLLVGAGLKSFYDLCPSFMRPDRIDFCNLHPHNLYIEWFAETGIIGILLFIVMVGALAYLCLKTLMLQRGINRLLPAFALACIIVNFFPFMPTQSAFSNWPAILLWYSVSAALASLNVLNKKEI